MLRSYGRLLRSLSANPLRSISTAVAPKRRGRPPKVKETSPTLPQKTKDVPQDAEVEKKPTTLVEIQAALEASGYGRRRTTTKRKPQTSTASEAATVTETPEVSRTKRKSTGSVAKPPPSSSPTASTPRLRKTKPKAPPLPPRLLPPTPQKHHDLASFLAHVSTANVNVTSTVYRGTHFEYTVAQTLRAFDFTLHRTGRSNDLGIDLVGHWSLPAQERHTHTMPVLIQCKASKLSPALVRELEGAYAGAPAGWRGEGVLGVLVSTQASTKGVSAAVQRSRWPLGVMQVTREGTVKQFVWNAVAAQAGLEGMGVAVRHSNPGAAENDKIVPIPEAGQSGLGQSICLTWMGKLWRPVKARKRTIAAPALPTLSEDLPAMQAAA